MRFIHTSDWHLGRILHGVSLLEDQVSLLSEIEKLVVDFRPELLLISGDLYDRSIPPVDAIETLDAFLTHLVIDRSVQAVIIPGNHDSAGRLSFASRLLESKGLHLAGSLERMAALDFQDKHGKVTIFPIPYAVPAEIDGASCHDDALAEQVRRLRAGRKLSRSVALAHCFVAGGTVSESERELCVGGSGQVRKENFDSFSYAALGHLHAPQTISSEKIRYSGSLFKYSFSEAGHKKGVVCVDMDANGGVKAEFMPLRPKRDLRRLRGQFKDLLIGKGDSGSKSDYIEFTLLDRGPVLDAMGRLRETYPNALHVRREADFWVPQEGPGKVDPARVDPVVLFSNFLKDTTNEPLSPKERPIFVEALKAALASEEGVE